MLLALKSVNGKGLNQRLCYNPGKQHQHHNYDAGQKSIPLTFITKFNLSNKTFCQQNHDIVGWVYYDQHEKLMNIIDSNQFVGHELNKK